MPRAPITITPAAKERIRKLLANAKEPVAGLRISVNSKGCSGLAYKVDYAPTPIAGDEVVAEDGITLYLDPAAIIYLLGTEMDYIETRLKSGFEFRNPNESGRCGCGESFYVDRDKLADTSRNHHAG